MSDAPAPPDVLAELNVIAFALDHLSLGEFAKQLRAVTAQIAEREREYELAKLALSDDKQFQIRAMAYFDQKHAERERHVAEAVREEIEALLEEHGANFAHGEGLVSTRDGFVGAMVSLIAVARRQAAEAVRKRAAEVAFSCEDYGSDAGSMIADSIRAIDLSPDPQPGEKQWVARSKK